MLVTRYIFLPKTFDFLHSSLSNVFTQDLQGASFYDPPSLSYDLVLKVAHLMQVFTVVDIFSCFSTFLINLAIRDDSNAYGNESSTTAGR